MKALTSDLHGLIALSYDHLGAPSIKMKKRSRCVLQKQEKSTSWLKRKNSTWKIQRRGIAKQWLFTCAFSPVEQLEPAELSTYISWCLIVTLGWWILNLISGIKSPGEYNERCSFMVLGGSWKTRVFWYVPCALVMTCGNKSKTR